MPVVMLRARTECLVLPHFQNHNLTLLDINFLRAKTSLLRPPPHVQRHLIKFPFENAEKNDQRIFSCKKKKYAHLDSAWIISDITSLGEDASMSHAVGRERGAGERPLPPSRFSVARREVKLRHPVREMSRTKASLGQRPNASCHCLQALDFVPQPMTLCTIIKENSIEFPMSTKRNDLKKKLYFPAGSVNCTVYEVGTALTYVSKLDSGSLGKSLAI